MKIVFASVYSILVLCTSFISSYGCRKQGQADITNIPVSGDDSGVRYLALGDSYTIGQGVAGNERFPFLTAALLRREGIAIQNPQYIATTGWTTANLLAAINSQSSFGIFDVVTLLIGVNDQYQGVDTATYRSRFTQLLTKAIQLAGNRPSRVFVLSIPDYSATPFVPASAKARVSREIDQFNGINEEVTLHYKIAYTNITPHTREAARDPTLLADDRLHYSAKEHQKWAELLVPLIKKAVQ